MVVVGVGFALAWTGYLILTLGYSWVKGKPVSVADLALPSHRSQAVAAMQSL